MINGTSSSVASNPEVGDSTASIAAAGDVVVVLVDDAVVVETGGKAVVEVDGDAVVVVVVVCSPVLVHAASRAKQASATNVRRIRHLLASSPAGRLLFNPRPLNVSGLGPFGGGRRRTPREFKPLVAGGRLLEAVDGRPHERASVAGGCENAKRDCRD